MILSQNGVGIAFLLSFIRVMQYVSKFQNIFMEPKGFIEYPKRGISCELSSFGHEQYPFDNLNQSN
jgi:hypothetical protein